VSDNDRSFVVRSAALVMQLKAARLAAGFTEEQLGLVLGLGCRHIESIENGDHIALDTAERWAVACRMSLRVSAEVATAPNPSVGDLVKGKTFVRYEVHAGHGVAFLRFITKDADHVDAAVHGGAIAGAIDDAITEWALTRREIDAWVGGPVEGLDVPWVPSGARVRWPR
jgi:transcriptional regulator with XRE-family HTH domain